MKSSRSLLGSLGRVIACGGLLVAALATTGCGPSRTAQQAAGDLASPDVVVRLKAAREVETNARVQKGLPPDVTELLLKQFTVEADAKTKASIITALGYTKDPRVKALLDPYLQTNDYDQQRWAARAYKKYVVATGQLPPEYKFPDNWPYGTPGFPPVAVKP